MVTPFFSSTYSLQYVNMANYQTIYQQMIDENHQLFRDFHAVHEAYVKNPQSTQTEFNRIGKELLDVILKYEHILCGKTEGGQYSKFSQNLSEKFRGLVRKDFPKFDYIGVVYS